MGGGAKVELLFSDDFEAETGWGIFEEIVGGSPCYGAGIGEVARTSSQAFGGTSALRIWANKSGSTKSNHVIGQRRYSTRGLEGRLRYQVQAVLTAGSDGNAQTGPEISVQNTREEAPGRFRTSTAGLRYQANPFQVPRGAWALWAQKSPGVAGWQVFTVRPVVAGQWYRLAIEADLDTNRYMTITIAGPDGNLAYEVSGTSIAHEPKFVEEAFQLTLEGENLFNNCGTAGTFASVVLYDDVALLRLQ